MSDTINRRDFLGGTALVIAAGLTPLAQMRAEPGRYYPPALTGLRGSHPGSFEVAHQVGREGKSFDISGLAVEQQFDLVVVGGGISGLAAAWFYREAHGPDARILILENHDDFGGHAKRNEFRVGDRLLLGYGGTESLQSPKNLFSKTVNRLLRSLGVDIGRFDTAFDRKLYGSLGLTHGMFFDRETFGVDRLVAGVPVITGGDSIASEVKTRPIEAVVAEFPLSGDARTRLIEFFKHPRDYLAGKSQAEKIAYLKKISYRDFLRKDAGLSDEAVKVFDGSTLGLMAMGPDILPALDAMGSQYAGFTGLGLDYRDDPEFQAFDEPYIYHFPDGNASIARLLVRSLIPTVAPGRTMEDVVLADFDYPKLDVDGAPIRLRLNSTAVAIANARTRGGPVDIGYVRAGALHRVRAKQCVLACYNMVIPHIMPELPDAQKRALALSVKMPLVYVNVAIRNWHAFVKLGVDDINSPHAYFSQTKLDYPVTLGGYRNPRDPNEPMLLHMEHIPLTPNRGLSNVQQFRLGRQLLLSTPFAEYESRIVDQLDRMLGPAGFQSSRDIAAITVNRWPHGYAYSADSLFDPETEGPQPYEIARKRCGNVTIANSDAGWNSYTHEAIDQAWRAVNELKSA
ncbi:MAG TPA: FAD/NAD(P)-binding protein [Steroidobacteraceae bacterium]|nr:FAD/NAD(P)-binding protein [Steroidobacteraceae bacterium]